MKTKFKAYKKVYPVRLTSYYRLKIKRFIKEQSYKLYCTIRNAILVVTDKLNFHEWKGKLLRKIIDIMFAACVITTTLVSIKSDNIIANGIGITLLLFVVMEFVIEFIKQIKKVCN